MGLSLSEAEAERRLHKLEAEEDEVAENGNEVVQATTDGCREGGGTWSRPGRASSSVVIARESLEDK
jgi:hypothetical protein